MVDAKQSGVGRAGGHQERLSGLVVVDKPVGWSSMDVCRVVRLSARPGRGRHKVGHCGTLDPLATGVLVVCIGRATKQVNRLMDQTKVYQTTIDLSAFTATDDAEEGQVREVVGVPVPPTLAQVEQAVAGMTGTIMQTPPAFSAVHIEGRRAYEAARAGERFRLGPRSVQIDRMEVLSYAFPELELRITCGKGTYIRSIARDLGKALGTGGYLKSLCRVASGPYMLEMSTPIQRFETRLEQGDLMAVGDEDCWRGGKHSTR